MKKIVGLFLLAMLIGGWATTSAYSFWDEDNPFIKGAEKAKQQRQRRNQRIIIPQQRKANKKIIYNYDSQNDSNSYNDNDNSEDIKKAIEQEKQKERINRIREELEYKPSSEQLKYNGFDNTWSYEKSDSHLKYNPYTNKHEWVEE